MIQVFKDFDLLFGWPVWTFFAYCVFVVCFIQTGFNVYIFSKTAEKSGKRDMRCACQLTIIVTIIQHLLQFQHIFWPFLLPLIDLNLKHNIDQLGHRAIYTFCLSRSAVSAKTCKQMKSLLNPSIQLCIKNNRTETNDSFLLGSNFFDTYLLYKL